MKKIAIIGFGIGDGFCSPNSPRFVHNGAQIAETVNEILKLHGNRLGAFVAVNNPADTFNFVNPIKGTNLPETRVIEVKLCGDSLIDVNNQLSLNSLDGEKMLFNGDQLDWFIRPEEYDIHIAGVDINGIFIKVLDELTAKGYNITVYSDAIKPFTKDTIKAIKGNPSYRFRSGRSVVA